jgi:hypothetical protein
MSYKEDDYLLLEIQLSLTKQTLNLIIEKMVLGLAMKFEYG